MTLSLNESIAMSSLIYQICFAYLAIFICQTVPTRAAESANIIKFIVHAKNEPFGWAWARSLITALNLCNGTPQANCKLHYNYGSWERESREAHF